MARKKTFEVVDNETIGDCLARIDEEGYRPVKRVEKPIFTEDREQNVTVKAQKIVFEAVAKD
ncbi:NETI motif-containing protein [Geomicrobium sp. JCM 19039]|uniref:NETI motif-containing protein n=1 Tax=Geomicrobium sp. JCM 19039 TaxID=1460636 RepID=UPI00045F40FD|nr:NETI motif-containing protein [Geomicrobium sp. JCM 19039]GAK13348.1 hypothetical protein JCM19039_3189 [Geomicrobium sp. JCM 19039]